MKTSVVVATYNGEKYIIEQLESIKDQSVNIDEVLISDDCSTDHTPQLCDEFIKKNNLSNWHFTINIENIGYRRNFWNVLHKASGDIIFLSDQDDIWLPNKVEIVRDIMSQNHAILLLSTSFSTMDENGAILTPRVNHRFQSRGSIRRLDFSEFLRFYQYMGMTMAINRRLLHLADLVGIDYNISHDIYANFVASLYGGSYHLDRVVVRRRSYKSVSIREKEREMLEEFEGCSTLCDISNRIKFLSQLSLKTAGKEGKLIEKHLEVAGYRREYIARLNLTRWLLSLRYIKYYRSYKEFISNGLEIIKRKRKATK